MTLTAQDREHRRSQSDSAIRVLGRGLSKRYGLRTVLRDVDLQIDAGESVVMFGPNGAGKTTLLRVLATLTRPQAGSLEINDLDAASRAIEIRRELGVLAHQPYVYDSLTGRENLRFFARMYEVPDAKQRIESVLGTVELRDRGDDLVGTYSRGMLQRIAIARAILHFPSVLLFDEPDTGLDPASVQVLEGILKEHCLAGGTLLMTTHNLQFGLRAAGRALVLVRGSIVSDLPAAEVDTSMLERIMGAPGA